MAEEAQGTHLTFNVKAGNDQKHVVSVTDNISVRDLKEKLSTTEFADVPADRQRLIYSGRVMKDADALSTYNIKDGNTIHMVKSAASTQQRNTEANSGTSTGSVPPNAGVPQNIAAGTGNDPLAGLTGARYAGFAQMPSMDTFGADGMGMGNPDDMLRMLENPMFQSQMNEAMNNPQVIQMMENNPMFRDQPHLREILRNPEMRRMMMDPAFIRQSMRFSQAMRGSGMGGGDSNMPAPGMTDTTPAQGQGAAGTQSQEANVGGQAQNPSGMFGQPGAGGQANPFASLFGGMPPSTPSTGSQAATTGTESTSRSTEPSQQQGNPFGGMFGGLTGGQGENPMQQMAQRMMQDPEMMRMAMNMMGGGGAGSGGAGGDQGPGAAFNPFAMLGGAGGLGASPATQDTRPPEEMYAEQLRSLNDMGFFDFDRNVRALRMAGGRVEGAVEMLLSGSI